MNSSLEGDWVLQDFSLITAKTPSGKVRSSGSGHIQAAEADFSHMCFLFEIQDLSGWMAKRPYADPFFGFLF